MAMFTMKKKKAMSTGGTTADRSLGTARSARPAMRRGVVEEPGRTGPDGGRVGRRVVGWTSMAVIGGPPRLRGGSVGRSVSCRAPGAASGRRRRCRGAMRLPVSSRNTSSSVGVRSVRSRTGRRRCRPARPPPGRSSRRRRRRVTTSSSCRAPRRRSRPATASAARRTADAAVAVDPDDDDVVADAALQLGRACPRRRAGRRR